MASKGSTTKVVSPVIKNTSVKTPASPKTPTVTKVPNAVKASTAIVSNKVNKPKIPPAPKSVSVKSSGGYKSPNAIT